MSVWRSSPNANAVGVSVAPEFWSRFVRDAHILIAEGFSRLNGSSLSQESEERISELIVEGVRRWYDENGRPDWTRQYFAKAEVPEHESSLEGKSRPRIDIYIESSHGPRRPPTFAFEAKRIYRSDSIAAYVGPVGLGAFIDGTYVPTSPAAGMLAYVQVGTNESAAEKVHAKLKRDRADCGLTSQAEVWSPVKFDARLGLTWVSHHLRVDSLGEVTIYHSFLRCCG